MAYSVEVRRTSFEGGVAVYTYGREGATGGRFFAVSTTSRTAWPSDRSGVPVSDLTLRIDDGEVTGSADDGDTRARFLEAVAGVVRALRSGQDAPETAHRYFG